MYEFPAMRSVSLKSADAFLLVFSLDNPESWEEVARLRDMVHDAKVGLHKLNAWKMVRSCHVIGYVRKENLENHRVEQRIILLSQSL